MTAKSGQLVFLSNVALTPRLRLRRFYESLGDARAMRGYPCRGLHCIAYLRSLFRLEPLTQPSTLNGSTYFTTFVHRLCDAQQG